MKVILRDPMLVLGFSILFLILTLVILGPVIIPNDPLEMDMENRLAGSSLQYPLGTDFFGRCIFSRIVEGAKYTLGLAFLVLLASVMIGVPIGLLSGFIGGKLDAILMRIVDGLIAFPDFILAIAIAGFLGLNMTNVVIAIIIVKWVSYARLVRSSTLAEKEKDYILAAQLNGSRNGKILVKHLFPHIASQVAIVASLDLGKIILIIASLSYLGIGAQPPTPEWGAMLNDARAYFQTFPTLMIYPGLAIMMTVLSFNLIGDGLREALDMKN